MSLNALKNTFLPELGYPKKGKVRDIYESEESLALIASDRISVFDCIIRVTNENDVKRTIIMRSFVFLFRVLWLYKH